MSISEQTVVLFPGVIRTVKLEFRYGQKQGGMGTGVGLEPRRSVLGVDDGLTTELYLFEVEPDTSG
jgi:hypothetical protein